MITDSLASDQMERALVQIWENVFGLKGIGIHDNFFSLGGHSLVGIRLVQQIEQQTGRKLRIDPKSGHILDDAEAMKQWARTYAPGWAPTV